MTVHVMLIIHLFPSAEATSTDLSSFLGFTIACILAHAHLAFAAFIVVSLSPLYQESLYL